MTVLNKLAPALNIRPGENRLVMFFLLHSFFVGMAQVLVSTTASTLFLNSFQDQTTQYLPYVYIGTAIVASSIGVLYTRLEKPLSFTRLLSANLGLLIIVLVGFRLMFYLSPQSQGAAMGLYIWYYVQDALINLEFWGLAASLFDVRQSKRLFGLIGAGEMAARIISGFSVRPLVKVIAPENLLWIAAAAIVLCLLLMLQIMRTHQANANKSPTPHATHSTPSAGQARRSFRELLRSRYIQLMVALIVLSLLGYYFVDIVFLDQARTQFPDKSELAGFLGDFFAVIGILAFLSRLFLAGRLISRYGLAAGLLVLPIAAAVGATSIAVVGTVLSTTLKTGFGATAALFYPAALTKLNFIVFRKSTDKSAFPILYQPLPENERVTVQTVMESIVAPIAGGLAGVFLLLLSLNIVQISYALLLIFGVWIAVIVMLNREYRSALLNAITKRRLGGIALKLTDNASLAALERSLKSQSPGEVLYALDVMEEAEHPNLENALKKLLRHPAEEVRLDVLQRIERLGLAGALKRVQNRLRLESAPEVLGAAIRAYAALGESEVLEEALPYLDDPRLPVRRGAMAGMLRSGGVEGVLAAGERFIALSRSDEPEERAFAAEILGEVGIRNFYRPLLNLLQDDSFAVRREALQAAEKLRVPPQLWPLVAANLSDYRARTAATSALAAGGKAIIPFLAKTFEQPGQSSRALTQIARAAGRIEGEEAANFLWSKIAFPDEAVRAQVLASLSSRRCQAAEAEIPLVQTRIRAEVADATWTLAALVDLEKRITNGEWRMNLTEITHSPFAIRYSPALLQNALLSKLTGCQERILLLLSLLYDSKAILRAKEILVTSASSVRSLSVAEGLEKSGASKTQNKAYALEVIDVFISQELKPMIFPLLEELPPARQLERLADAFPQPQMSLEERLIQIIQANGREAWRMTNDERQEISTWLRACALYSAGLLAQPSLVEAVASALSAPQALIKETAILALSRLAPNEYQDQVSKLQHDSDQRVVRAAKRYNVGQDNILSLGDGKGQDNILSYKFTGATTMLSTFEKVLILKAVDIFSATPDDVLAEAAAILDDVELEAGDTLFKKGDMGDAMYIIAAGKIRIHDGEQSLAELGERSIFGELTVLDTESRSASATALEQSHLFRLSQGSFYELMSDQPQIAQGVIKVLSRRLRAQNELLADREVKEEKRKRPRSSDIEGIFDRVAGS